MKPALSVVIPCYNEASRLASTLPRILGYLQGRGEPFEIVVVDDGSRDTTAEVAAGFTNDGVRVLPQAANRGKGAALKVGVLASRGARVLLSDADLSTPIEELERLQPALEEAELVLGSRAVDGARILTHQPFYRELMGKTFNLMVRLSGVRGIRDTQCGFKLLQGEVARELFAELTVQRFAYDVELVWLAQRRGYRVVEVGVTWADSLPSKVHVLRDPLSMFLDLFRMRLRHRRQSRS